MSETVFRVGDIVRTTKGAKFVGRIMCFDNDPAIPGCTVRAFHPDFLGIKHVYPLKQLEIAPTPPQPAVGVEHECHALATMVYEAVRFANWAAGEGICPVANEPAGDPGEFLSAYCSAIDSDDYAGLEIVARDAVLSALSRAAPEVGESKAGWRRGMIDAAAIAVRYHEKYADDTREGMLRVNAAAFGKSISDKIISLIPSPPEQS